MKKIILSLMALATVSAYAQFGGRGQGNPTVPSVTENVTEDFKPAANNQANHQYPMVNSTAYGTRPDIGPQRNISRS